MEGILKDHLPRGRRRCNVISEKAFDDLPVRVNWRELEIGRVYKLVSRINSDVELINSDGIRKIVYLPEFMLRKLFDIHGKVTVYVKFTAKMMDVGIVHRIICPKCQKDFASKQTLLQHTKFYCRF